MDEQANRQAMASAGVDPANYEQVQATAVATGVDFATVLQFFMKYGPMMFEILTALGILKPKPPVPAPTA